SVLPARGRFRAGLWYWRQVLSFVSPLAMGVTFGTVLGVANLIDTAIEPLADDDAPKVLLLAAIVVAIWAILTFLAARRVQNVRQAIVAGMLIGGATLFMFGLANTIRINVFLDTIQYRDDWRNLMARFRESDYTSLRAFVNRDYVRPLVGSLGVGGAIGALIGAIAGAVEKLTRGMGVS